MPDRGPYRSLYTCIQDDPDFQALDSDARLVFYTLKFSPLGNVAGIFVYHVDAGVTHSGLPRDRFEGALKRLEEGRWVARQGPLVWIRNGLKFEPGYSMADPNKKKGVEKLLCGLPSLSILQQFADAYSCEAPSGPLRDGFEAPSKGPLGPPPYKESGSRSTETDPERTTERSAQEGASLPEDAHYPLGAWFEWEFWKAYPKHNLKREAEKALKKLNPDNELRDTILRAITARKQWVESAAKLKRAGEDVFLAEWPDPHRWVNKRRWEDEPPTWFGVAHFRPDPSGTPPRRDPYEHAEDASPYHLDDGHTQGDPEDEPLPVISPEESKRRKAKALEDYYARERGAQAAQEPEDVA